MQIYQNGFRKKSNIARIVSETVEQMHDAYCALIFATICFRKRYSMVLGGAKNTPLKHFWIFSDTKSVHILECNEPIRANRELIID